MDDVRRAAYSNWIWAGLQLFMGGTALALLPDFGLFAVPMLLQAGLLALAGLLTYRRNGAGPMLAMGLYAIMGVTGVGVALTRGGAQGLILLAALVIVLGNFSYKALLELRRSA